MDLRLAGARRPVGPSNRVPKYKNQTLGAKHCKVTAQPIS